MLRMRIDDSKNQDYEIYKIVKSHCCIAGPSSKCLLKIWLLVVHDPAFRACARLLKKLRDNFCLLCWLGTIIHSKYVRRDRILTGFAIEATQSEHIRLQGLYDTMGHKIITTQKLKNGT